MSADPFTVRHFTIEGRHVLTIDAVPTFSERVVPPAGEEYAFDVQHYRAHVEVSVSKTGRSVQVWVGGERVK